MTGDDEMSHQERSAMTKIVGVAIENIVPTRLRQDFLANYNCRPPPIFMILISLIEVSHLLWITWIMLPQLLNYILSQSRGGFSICFVVFVSVCPSKGFPEHFSHMLVHLWKTVCCVVKWGHYDFSGGNMHLYGYHRVVVREQVCFGDPWSDAE